ncbi:hypothetical protein BDR26DRAFT_875677 [Obelidium mucronatum]|nr:hypothetical protein BDR26DRAFT_875677 [Obelidium mucronatum]
MYLLLQFRAMMIGLTIVVRHGGLERWRRQSRRLFRLWNIKGEEAALIPFIFIRNMRLLRPRLFARFARFARVSALPGDAARPQCCRSCPRTRPRRRRQRGKQAAQAGLCGLRLSRRRGVGVRVVRRRVRQRDHNRRCLLRLRLCRLGLCFGFAVVAVAVAGVRKELVLQVCGS